MHNITGAAEQLQQQAWKVDVGKNISQGHEVDINREDSEEKENDKGEEEEEDVEEGGARSKCEKERSNNQKNTKGKQHRKKGDQKENPRESIKNNKLFYRTQIKIDCVTPPFTFENTRIDVNFTDITSEKRQNWKFENLRVCRVYDDNYKRAPIKNHTSDS